MSSVPRHDGPRMNWNAVKAAVNDVFRQAFEPPRPRLILKVPPPVWAGRCPAFRPRTEDDRPATRL